VADPQVVVDLPVGVGTPALCLPATIINECYYVLSWFFSSSDFIVERIFQDQNEVGFACIVNLQVSVAYPHEAQLWAVSLCVDVAGCRRAPRS
jgi:hypothetical protein